jgi:hypothetical protein
MGMTLARLVFFVGLAVTLAGVAASFAPVWSCVAAGGLVLTSAGLFGLDVGDA